MTTRSADSPTRRLIASVTTGRRWGSPYAILVSAPTIGSLCATTPSRISETPASGFGRSPPRLKVTTPASGWSTATPSSGWRADGDRPHHRPYDRQRERHGRADGVGVALRYPGSGVSLTKNGVVGPGGRGYDLGPAKAPNSTISLVENQVSGALRSGFYLRAAKWHLDPDGEHRCELRLGFRGGRRKRR